jgi:hypothetical protein
VGNRGGPLFRRNIKSKGFFTKWCSSARVSLATSDLTGLHMSERWLSSGNLTISALRHNIARIMIVKCQNGQILCLCEILCANVVVFYFLDST